MANLKLIVIIAIISFMNISANSIRIKEIKIKAPARFVNDALTKNIEFDFNKTGIKENYYTQLDSLAKALLIKNRPLILRGYADSRGSYVANWKISDGRANAIRDYLIKEGIESNNIVASPFGSNNPIASNNTAYGRQKNRRVEIIIK